MRNECNQMRRVCGGGWWGSALAAVVGLAAVGLAGCEVAPRTDEPAEPTPTEAEARQFEPIAAERLIRLAEREGVYRMSEGPLEGQELAFRMWEEEGLWVLEVEDRQRSYFYQDQQGNIVMPRHEDFIEQVRVEYDPAILVIPATVDNEEHEGTAEVAVYNLEDGSPRTQGTATYRLWVEDYHPVEAPIGEHPAYVIRRTQELRLSLANVQVELVTAYAPGVGRLYDRNTQRTRALGLFGGGAQTEELLRVE